MIRAVCLDLDGTLAEYRGDFDELLDAVRTDLGLLACDFTTFKQRLGEELLHDGPVTLASALARTLEGLEQRVPADLPQVVERAVGHYLADLRLRPGAIDLLEDLIGRNVPLALLTNGPSDMQRAAVAALGLEPYFAAILVSGDEDVAARKPSPRIFALACARLGSNPGETLMVGDDPAKDIEGARSAGLAAYGVTDSLDEVRSWLAEQRRRELS